MAYIDGVKYAELTGKSAGDATDDRIRMAERALDDRIGIWPRVDPLSIYRLGDLLGGANPHGLRVYQIEAVQRWCSWYVNWLKENNDNLASRPQTESVKLGKFSVRSEDVPSRSVDQSIYGFMQPYDAELVDVGMVRP